MPAFVSAEIKDQNAPSGQNARSVPPERKVRERHYLLGEERRKRCATQLKLASNGVAVEIYGNIETMKVAMNQQTDMRQDLTQRRAQGGTALSVRLRVLEESVDIAS